MNYQDKKDAVLTTTSYKNDKLKFESINGVKFFDTFEEYSRYIWQRFGVVIKEDDLRKWS